MSNQNNGNIFYLDTFSSDIIISSTPCEIIGITMYTQTAPDKLVLKDNSGQIVVNIQTSSNNQTIEFSPCCPIRCNGLVLKVSDGNYDGTSIVMIYLR